MDPDICLPVDVGLAFTDHRSSVVSGPPAEDPFGVLLKAQTIVLAAL